MIVRVASADGVASLVVEDDGRGFDPVEASTNGGVGLTSMKERLEAMGGDLTVRSLPWQGTSIEATALIPG